MARLLLVVCVQLVLACAARALDDCGKDSLACGYYTDETVCHGNQKAWARLNCPNLCGNCGQDEEGSEENDSFGSKKRLRSWSDSSDASDEDDNSSDADEDSGCKDVFPLCQVSGRAICRSSASLAQDWAVKNCAKFCGFCGAGAVRTLIGTAQGEIPESFCSFGGNAYKQGETWEDGCKKNCTCVNAVTNAMLCKDRCPTWNLGPDCVSQQVSNECCERVFCRGSTRSIPTVLPRSAFY
ncbi:uncharacterized protein LOC135484473 [Lineus longissimus]|uniref:uncharacterized protein LOC135484473 n=1 Tax=Lineus longissimus TaxID=88925 RepID=UPI002B4F1FAA